MCTRVYQSVLRDQAIALRYDCSKKSREKWSKVLFQLCVRRLCSKIAIVRRMQFCSNYNFVRRLQSFEECNFVPKDYVRRLQSFEECNFLNMHFEQKVRFDHYLSNTKLEHVFPDQPCSWVELQPWCFVLKGDLNVWFCY